MKRLCTILARGGSKGVANKNVRELAGKPLLAHSIVQAQRSGFFDHIAVSSDSDLILQTAEKWGVKHRVRRPEELATDAAPKVPAIRHCLLEVEKILGSKFETVCDLDPTSPFRRVEDIAECVRLLERGDASNVVTAAPARKSPYFNLLEADGNGAPHLSKPLSSPIGRRQDSPKCYDMNASIYVWTRDSLLSQPTLFGPGTKLFVMPVERSIEIDTEYDFEVAGYFAGKGWLIS